MPAKKNSRTKPISDSDILAMYEAVLPLLYRGHGHDWLNGATKQIKLQVLNFLQFDFYHYVFQFEADDHDDAQLAVRLDQPERHDNANPKIQPKQKFEKAIESDYQDCLVELREKYSNRQKFDYYRILSTENPKIAVGIFRRVDETGANCFSKDDKQLLERLAPHIFLMHRTLLLHVYHSENIQYFTMFTKLASKLADDYQLSGSEVKLIPEILFGYSNEEIAERQFVSVPTVKSHLNHILKKTGTKNRIDFLAKFFTSPEHVQL